MRKNMQNKNTLSGKALKWQVKRKRPAEFLEGLVSPSKGPRNEGEFLASPRPRSRKNIFQILDLGLVPRKILGETSGVFFQVFCFYTSCFIRNINQILLCWRYIMHHSLMLLSYLCREHIP